MVELFVSQRHLPKEKKKKAQMKKNVIRAIQM